MILQLKITLADSKPAIWRRISIPSDYSLHALHHAIQSSFDWFNGHLHQFYSPRSGLYSLPEDFMELMSDKLDLLPIQLDDPVVETTWDEKPVVDSRSAAISTCLEMEGDEMLYTYDFGDNWEHIIVVEKIFPIGPTLPVLMAGENQRPPEDCGGIDAFKGALKLLKKKKKSDDDLEEIEMVFGDDWEDFDPKEFDLADHAKALQSKFLEATEHEAKDT